MSIQQSGKAEFVDGILNTVSIFCSDTDFVPMYGVVTLSDGSLDDSVLLQKSFDEFYKNTRLTEIKEVEWTEDLKLIFDRWVIKCLSVPNNRFLSLPDHVEALYDFLCEVIQGEKESNGIKAKHIQLSGGEWGYDAECLAVDDGEESYALYFMYSD